MQSMRVLHTAPFLRREYPCRALGDMGKDRIYLQFENLFWAQTRLLCAALLREILGVVHPEVKALTSEQVAVCRRVHFGLRDEPGGLNSARQCVHSFR